MLSDLQKDRAILEELNSNLLFYRLCSIDPATSERFNESCEGFKELPDFDAQYSGFEGMINEAFDSLQPESRGKPGEVDVRKRIIDLARAVVYDFGMLDMGIDTLDDLKERMVSAHIESVMAWTKACLAPLPNAYRNLLGSMDADVAFPKDGNGESQEQKASVVAGLDKRLQSVSPDRLPDYLADIKKIVFGFNDLRAGSQKLEELERSLFEWCITPSMGISSGLNIEDFDRDKCDYARLLLQMEELEYRLGFMQRRWESMLLNISGDDSNDEREGLKKVLEERRAEIGSPALIEEMRGGKKSLVNILKQIALLGPMHLEMARSYAGIFAKEIENRVFGLRQRVTEYKESERYVIVTEPRELRKYDLEQMARFGFSEKDLAAFGETAYGILSGYTIHPIPPKKCPANQSLPPEMEHLKGELYKTRMIKVIDFYADRKAVPAELLPAFDRKANDRELGRDDPMRDDPALSALLENIKLPRGSGQACMKYDVIFARDWRFENTAKLCTVVGGEFVPIYEHTARQMPDKVHSMVERLLSAGSHNSRMPRDQFVQMVRSYARR
jgi:hypothetical protein